MAKRRKPNRNPDHGKGLLKRLAERPVSVQTSKDQPPEVYHLMNFEITWDVMPDPAVDALPKATRDRMEKLFELAQKQSKSVVAELRELTAKHPEVLCFANWLIAALRRGGKADQEEALSLCDQVFRDHPGYFFARTTLADLWLDRGEIEKASGLLFVPGHSISTLYPARKVFHISEIRHWAYLSARAKILLGEPEIAVGYRDMLEELEPDSPAVQDLNDMLDGEKSGIMRRLASLRKFAVKAQERAGQRKERRKTKEPAKPPAKPATNPPTKSGAHPDQLDLLE
jgi:hypothetical protein